MMNFELKVKMSYGEVVFDLLNFDDSLQKLKSNKDIDFREIEYVAISNGKPRDTTRDNIFLHLLTENRVIGTKNELLNELFIITYTRKDGTIIIDIDTEKVEEAGQMIVTVDDSGIDVFQTISSWNIFDEKAKEKPFGRMHKDRLQIDYWQKEKRLIIRNMLDTEKELELDM